MGKLLSRIYRKFFWQAYDNVGRLLVLNLIWFVTFPLVTFLVARFSPLSGTANLALTALVGLLTSCFAGSGVFALTARLARREEITVKQFLPEVRRFFLRTLALGVIFGAVFLLLFYSIRFYAGFLPGTSGSPDGAGLLGPTASLAEASVLGLTGGGIIGFFLAGIQIWILAFCLLMQVYALPLLFLKGWGIRQTIKWSAILVVLRPGLTVLIFIQAFALFGVLALTGIGFVILAYSLVSLFLNVALREALRDLEAKWTPKTRPTSWKEIFAGDDRGPNGDDDEEEHRTLKNILRPWDS